MIYADARTVFQSSSGLPGWLFVGKLAVLCGRAFFQKMFIRRAKFEEGYAEVLVQRRRMEVAMVEPEEGWMYYDAYLRKHGDPLTNGLGHTRANVNGKDIVLIPLEEMGRIRRHLLCELRSILIPLRR